MTGTNGVRTVGYAKISGLCLLAGWMVGCAPTTAEGARSVGVPADGADARPNAEADQRKGEGSVTAETLEAHAERLATEYCHDGGGLFGPPTGKPYPPYEDWDYQRGDPLASCDEIDATVVHTWEQGDVSAGFIQLEAIVEDADGNGPGLVGVREWISVRTADSIRDYLLVDREVTDFEEAPDEDFDLDYEAARFEDVVGGRNPDFIAVRSHSVGDCYECDFCHAQSEQATYLVVCGDHPKNPGCVEMALTWEQTMTPRDDPSDCDDPPGPDEEAYSWGFEVAFRIPEKGVLLIEPAAGAPAPDGPPWVEPTKPGRFDLDDLFEAEDTED